MRAGVLRRAIAGALGAGICALALGAASAQAQTHTFVNDHLLFPVGGAGNVGPASEYPSRITVTGVPGTVTNATVELIGLSSGVPDNIDAVVVGPNGAKIMLMSDACGQGAGKDLQITNFVFSDDATRFLSSSGPCPSFDTEVFRPTNFLGNDGNDNLSPDGGPSPPYTSSLAAFDGISPNGNWDLFLRDDDEAVFGFGLSGWVLRLDVEPPSNEFRIIGLDGRALAVTVESAGVVSIADDAGLMKSNTVSGGPGRVLVPLKLFRQGKKKLRNTGKLKLQPDVTFTPDGGTAASQSTKVKIKK